MADVEAIREQVEQALKTVNDPELGIDIWHLGLVYDLDVDDDGNVEIKYTLTTMGCPIGPMIEDEIRQATSGIEELGELHMEMTMYPPWTPEKMHPLAKSALGFV